MIVRVPGQRNAGEDSGIEPRTLFVSDALQARLDAFCEGGAGRSPTSVTFDAVEHFRGDLADLVRAARVRLASPVAEERDVRYVGVGPVQVKLRPGVAGASLLDRLSTELDLPWRTWVPAVLNAYLPGRQEPDNMPWLERAEP